ncbi:hypothetical protein GCM10010267_30290 [Streptomyces griseorubens]|nr:hypothetical protein GCM10010267_30290 [Streptomyces griseorubens]
MWGSTGRVPFSTCETVATETPALRATSAMVAIVVRSPLCVRGAGLSAVGRPTGMRGAPSEAGSGGDRIAWEGWS